MSVLSEFCFSDVKHSASPAQPDVIYRAPSGQLCRLATDKGEELSFDYLGKRDGFLMSAANFQRLMRVNHGR